MSGCFDSAKEFYASIGVDVEAAINRLSEIPVSLHCWQGDDVSGFENAGSLDGGLAVTGNYPGRARNAEELRKDIAKVLTLIPGKKRLNLHAIYAETDGKKVERNELETKHFVNWLNFAKEQNIGLDFNPTCFAHPLAENGTLTNADAGIRNFWIEHAIACRRIAADFGKELNNTWVTNIWIPDGSKDTPYDRLAPRKRLMDSLDAILAEKIDSKYNRDAVESKLFGIGAESCTYGSHEFYMGYAVSRGILLCLDAGHFHPTEVISDKFPALCSIWMKFFCMFPGVSAGTVTMWFAGMVNCRRSLRRSSVTTTIKKSTSVWIISMLPSIVWQLGASVPAICTKHCFLPCLNRQKCWTMLKNPAILPAV